SARPKRMRSLRLQPFCPLANLATIGGGPAMQYNGRIPLYNVADLDEWANSRLSKRVLATSEAR
ncbi:hypothetical protein AB9F45_36130, partial [Rhizobium leguminosarum]